MIDTTNLSDRAVNLLARWDDLEGGPMGSEPFEVDPETAILVEENGVITKVADPEEFAVFTALALGLDVDTVLSAPEFYLAPGVVIYRGIGEVK